MEDPININTINNEKANIPVDPYETLGISRKASVYEIEQAYRNLARKYHPDVNPGNKIAAEWFIAVAEARDLLIDPTKNEGKSIYFKGYTFSQNSKKEFKKEGEYWDKFNEKEEEYWKKF